MDEEIVALCAQAGRLAEMGVIRQVFAEDIHKSFFVCTVSHDFVCMQLDGAAAGCFQGAADRYGLAVLPDGNLQFIVALGGQLQVTEIGTAPAQFLVKHLRELLQPDGDLGSIALHQLGIARRCLPGSGPRHGGRQHENHGDGNGANENPHGYSSRQLGCSGSGVGLLRRPDADFLGERSTRGVAVSIPAALAARPWAACDTQSA